MSAFDTPRGIRNHNPGNLRRNNTKWQGLAEIQTDPEFYQFLGPSWGVRAMARTLLTYFDKHGLKTAREIISRWAPPVGQVPGGKAYTQDTESYIAHVEGVVGKGELNLHSHNDLAPLVKVMIEHENGVQPYSDAVINRGLELAGVVPDKRPIAQSPEGQAGAVVSSAAGVAAMADLVNQALPALPVVKTLAENAPWVLAIGVIAGLAWFFYKRKDS